MGVALKRQKTKKGGSELLLPNLGCLCTPIPKRNAESELEETGKEALIAQQRGKHNRLVPQGLFPPAPTPQGVVRNLSVPEGGCDQLMGIFLIGWW